MSGRYYGGPAGITPFTRARAQDVNANLTAVGDSFDKVEADVGQTLRLSTAAGTPDPIAALPGQQALVTILPNGNPALLAPSSLGGGGSVNDNFDGGLDGVDASGETFDGGVDG